MKRGDADKVPIVRRQVAQAVSLHYCYDERVVGQQAIPLALGYRTWKELHATHPDVNVAPVWRLLVDTLFPKVASFIYTIY